MKKVELHQIIDKLQMRFMNTTVCYNKITGEILNVNDDDFRYEE